MEFKTTILFAALQDLDDAVNWYNEIQPELGKDLVLKFQQALIEIEEKPLLSQKLNQGFRKVNLKRFPYKLVFKIEEKEIIIIAVAHHKRKSGYWKKRK
ncbi:type II toxin-antitoxin system RelE/ParE family toxin [Moheibacter sediminis]|uniref:ParE toxin of type II toxin-antitoxin system, parDE n=1 Tax=Moheibacter sediminis TaxID=1434700 RepID=A0A1W1Z682_9FLAO|nr:type II toxin-antitoxin system RelE/ParE family toxin [Moheibacter sediminis]SMC43812.1 ParE toxin of type II toxin-antitoxin system, parDE [Moheibacter sediminis]